MSKNIFIIAGPNGAGKTTTTISLFPDFAFIIEDKKIWENIQRLVNG